MLKFRTTYVSKDPESPAFHACDSSTVYLGIQVTRKKRFVVYYKQCSNASQ